MAGSFGGVGCRVLFFLGFAHLRDPYEKYAEKEESKAYCPHSHVDGVQSHENSRDAKDDEYPHENKAYACCLCDNLLASLLYGKFFFASGAGNGPVHGETDGRLYLVVAIGAGDDCHYWLVFDWGLILCLL